MGSCPLPYGDLEIGYSHSSRPLQSPEISTTGHVFRTPGERPHPFSFRGAHPCLSPLQQTDTPQLARITGGHAPPLRYLSDGSKSAP